MKKTKDQPTSQKRGGESQKPVAAKGRITSLRKAFPRLLRKPDFSFLFRVNINIATALEITAIGLVCLTYAYPLLNMDPNLGLVSGEYQTHVGFMSLFNRWLHGEFAFPLWNPIMGFGRSLIADPFMFFFNPFVSLPMVLFGVVNGTKIALLLNFFIAGLGMWVLARVLKLGRTTRLWCALLYMMSGAIPSHLHVGQIQLSFSLCWLPWSVAGLIWVLRRRTLGAVALASLAQALFFFTANLYHQVFSLFCLLIIAIVFAVDWKKFQLKMEVVRHVLLLGVFSLGLIAVQFLPMLTSRSSMHNIGGFPLNDQHFEGSQLPEYAFINYIVADPEFSRNPVLEKNPCPQENYRFIGIAPILMVLFLVPAYRRGNRKEIIAFGLSFLFLLAWASLRYSFIKGLYDFLPILFEFRDPGRALSVGGLFLILASGYGLDQLWCMIGRKSDSSEEAESLEVPENPRIGYIIASVFLIVALVFSLRRVYGENRNMIFVEWIYKPDITLGVEWLLDQDQGDLTVEATHTISDKLILEAYQYGIRSPNFIDGWKPDAPPYTFVDRTELDIRPRYRLNWEYDDIPEADYQLVHQVGELGIWEADHPFPYAFLIPMEQVLSRTTVYPEDVLPAISYDREGANAIDIVVKAEEESLLVISESWFEDWSVSVDDEPGEVVAAGDFLAVRVGPGRHDIVFEYAPTSFKVGLLISAVTVLCIIGVGIESLRRSFVGRLGEPE